MDALVSAALVGTARQPREPLGTGTPVDALVAALPEMSMERRLLLAAGAYDTYRAAGRVAAPAPAALEPCPRDVRPFCSPGATQLLERLLAGQHEELLPEAVRLLREAGQVLSPALLLRALEVRNPLTQQALLGVVGERGRWLAHLVPNREWALVVPPGEDSPLGDVETLWQEGSQAQRVEALRRLRLTDPGRARQLLADAWPREGEQFRLAVLSALETGLAEEDEPLLEAALHRCTRELRERLSALLARIPHSAFATRMRERADSMLEYVYSVLSIEPPVTCPSDWRRDGITVRGPDGTDERDWWLMQVLAFVPPAHWEQRFGATPAALVAAGALNGWNQAIIEGWSWAALLHGDTRWMPALWDWWAGRAPSSLLSHVTVRGISSADMRSKLIAQMPTAEAELRAWWSASLAPIPITSARLTHSAHPTFAPLKAGGLWGETVEALPAPWSHEFGTRYLRGVRDTCDAQPAPMDYEGANYIITLERAAVALPPSCFALALQPWKLPARATDLRDGWVAGIEQFLETLRFRQRLFEEIHA